MSYASHTHIGLHRFTREQSVEALCSTNFGVVLVIGFCLIGGVMSHFFISLQQTCLFPFSNSSSYQLSSNFTRLDPEVCEILSQLSLSKLWHRVCNGSCSHDYHGIQTLQKLVMYYGSLLCNYYSWPIFNSFPSGAQSSLCYYSLLPLDKLCVWNISTEWIWNLIA